MLAVSSISINQVDKDGDNNREGTPSKMEAILEGEYRHFSEAHNLLDSVDLDDLFMDMHDGDALPDLEMDPDFLVKLVGPEVYRSSEANNRIKGANNDYFTMVNSSMKESNKRKKSSVYTRRESSNNDNNSKQGKPKKAKVDWKPELHRKFVEAVEELGVDSSVPSKILELMGVESLTRHNIASHLQKYRSHIKHLLTKDKMATNWTQGRQMCGVIGVGKGANPSPWLSTTIMGVNPMNMHHPLTMRPLHVWGHPMARTPYLHGKMPMWPPSVWPPSPPQPPPDPSICHSPHQYRLTGTPVASIPPQAMYRPTHTNVSPPPTTPSSFLSQPSTNHDSIDTAIGDVLAKPWLPLPIGLKPPSVDSVLIELQRQGIPKIPPSSPPGFDR